MIEVLKDHWSFIIVLGTGLIWVGRTKTALDEICKRLREHGQEIAGLRKEHQGMQLRADCLVSQDHCQTDIRRALDDYRGQFVELKHMIHLMDQKREESRKELFQLFRDIDEKRENNKREMDEYFKQFLQEVRR
ncbi:MAG: hypothetical protein AB7U43_09745 [Desulfobacter sp.]